jgi:hypothetical protein
MAGERLLGKVALVTAGGSGMGSRSCVRMAKPSDASSYITGVALPVDGATPCASVSSGRASPGGGLECKRDCPDRLWHGYW